MLINPIKILYKTYGFLILRFLVSLGVIFPGYFIAIWAIKLGRKWSGLDLLVTDLLFAYCGIAGMAIYFSAGKKLSLHFINYAHIAGMTGVINGTLKEKSSVRYGISLVFSRIGPVSFMFVADKFLRKVLNRISKWILENSKIIPDSFKKGFISRFVGDSIKSLIFSVLPVTTSYLYMHKDEKFWDGTLKAISLYLQSWKQTMKAAFLNTLWIKVFGKVVNIVIFVVFMVQLWGEGIQQIITYYIFYKFILFVLKETFMEPYQMASMLVGFHEGCKDKEPKPEALNSIEDLSSKIKDTVFNKKESSDELINNVVEAITSALPEDLLGRYGKVIDKIFSRGGEKGEVSGEVREI